MSVKTDDIVTLVVDGQELPARVEKTYEDIDQKYVDVRVLAGGPSGGVAYQAVSPESEGSIRHFLPMTAAEQKTVVGDTERREEGEPRGAAPKGTVAVAPTPDKDLPAGAKPQK